MWVMCLAATLSALWHAQAEALAVSLDDPQRLAEVLLFLSRHFSFMSAHDQASAMTSVSLHLPLPVEISPCVHGRSSVWA